MQNLALAAMHEVGLHGIAIVPAHEVQRILRGVPGIDFVYFDEGDVVRHRLVSAIIRAYGVHETRAAADREDGARSEPS